MPRAADYSIQGFLYQFNKTLLEILRSTDGSEVTVEGIIEDIEIVSPSSITAIQCKYHEANESFTLSAIYKPLLQMMFHFNKNLQSDIRYVLYAHFPGQSCTSSPGLGKAELEEVLASNNRDLAKYTDALRGGIDLDEFLKKLSIQFGPPYDQLVEDVSAALEQNGIPDSDIDTLVYPNAIHTIANLSIKHNPQERKITKRSLLEQLRSVRKTAISRWTLGLKTRKQLLDAKRKQLRSHLAQNSRLRHFLVYANSLDDFDSEIITFVSDYLSKYHFKPTHISTPLFCFDTTEVAFKDIQFRIHQKGIVQTDGYIGGRFDESHFYRTPMIEVGRRTPFRREFSLRTLRWECDGRSLNSRKSDDLFILGEGDSNSLDTNDVNVEILATSSLKEIKYVMGVSDAYE